MMGSMLSTPGINYVCTLPQETLEYILYKLDVNTILKCREVSVLFRDVISTSSFWRVVLLKTPGFDAKTMTVIWPKICNFEWNQLAVMALVQPFSRNYIKNGCGQDTTGCKDKSHGFRTSRRPATDFKPWEITPYIGDGWEVQESPYGADPVPSHPDIEGNKCFASSFGEEIMRQTVSFLPIVYKFKPILDAIQPYIYVSDWCAGRFDAPSVYRLKVVLENKELDNPIDSYTTTLNLGSDSTLKEWQQVKHIFPYNPDVQCVVFMRSAKDRCGWSGWYGAKATGAAVRLLPLCPPDS